MNSEFSSAGNSSEPAPRSGDPAVLEPAAAPAPSSHAGKMPLKIPPILLEGDETAPAPIGGDAEKFSLGPTASVQQLETEGELPEAYGTQKLLLTARDPHWLYAHWDLTREQQRAHCAQAADGHLILRVHHGEVSDQPVAEVHVRPEARHWFVHVESAGTTYTAELGFSAPTGQWTAISTSDATLTPPDTRSPDTSVEFATIPFELPLEKMLLLTEGAASENWSLAHALEQLRIQGHPDLPASPPVEEWTIEQESSLAEVLGLTDLPRFSIGSMEIAELIRPRFHEEVSSPAASPFSAPTSPVGVSSPFGGWQPAKSFWFNVNAELIIYGATEPSATVTIGGRPIKLRPDGSFSYRFALPDGNYELPVVAISADQTDARAAELTFSRATELRGDVGSHPQDPKLKPPAPENL
jgi:uncharacterized protein